MLHDPARGDQTSMSGAAMSRASACHAADGTTADGILESPKQAASRCQPQTISTGQLSHKIIRQAACRMERAVLCGTLWHEDCRKACYPAEAAALPNTFASAPAYIRAYEPLLFSEAQAGILQTATEQHHRVAVDIYRCSMSNNSQSWH